MYEVKIVNDKSYAVVAETKSFKEKGAAALYIHDHLGIEVADVVWRINKAQKHDARRARITKSGLQAQIEFKR